MFSRRRTLKCLALGAIGWRVRIGRTAETESALETPVAFEWRVPVVHLRTVEDSLVFEGEVRRQEDAKGVPLWFVFAGIALLPYLARSVLSLRRDIVHGGVVIDTRGDTVQIDTDKSLAGGTIVVVNSQGAEVYFTDDINDAAELLAVLKQGDAP